MSSGNCEQNSSRLIRCAYALGQSEPAEARDATRRPLQPPRLLAILPDTIVGTNYALCAVLDPVLNLLEDLVKREFTAHARRLRLRFRHLSRRGNGVLISHDSLEQLTDMVV